MLDANEARRLLDSIDTTTRSDMRDRALIGLFYSFARIGAALGMKVEYGFTPNRRLRVWRRLAKARIDTLAGYHTFRATGTTAYLKSGGTLEKVAAMAIRASTRTTLLYDRFRGRGINSIHSNP